MGYVLDMFGYECLILFGYDVSLWEVMGHDLGDILACQIHGGHGGPHGVDTGPCAWYLLAALKVAQTRLCLGVSRWSSAPHGSPRGVTP